MSKEGTSLTPSLSRVKVSSNVPPALGRALGTPLRGTLRYETLIEMQITEKTTTFFIKMQIARQACCLLHSSLAAQQLPWKPRASQCRQHTPPRAAAPAFRRLPRRRGGR